MYEPSARTLRCTYTSGPSISGAMKPNPRSSNQTFTVPACLTPGSRRGPAALCSRSACTSRANARSLIMRFPAPSWGSKPSTTAVWTSCGSRARKSRVSPSRPQRLAKSRSSREASGCSWRGRLALRLPSPLPSACGSIHFTGLAIRAPKSLYSPLDAQTRLPRSASMAFSSASTGPISEDCFVFMAATMTAWWSSKTSW
mmetsp:Transcript_60608/g.177195  ORF Transcript_60608/g.177195 Transcript_60608/m.177195 type:complete len:200 (+) Transcript_60608:973-1572(+)